MVKGEQKEVFEKELKALETFNGQSHPHIITLLAAYRQQEKYHLLFPWAEQDLLRWWETNQKPTRNVEEVRWMSKHCLKVAEALHVIHFPRGQDQLRPTDQRYGRHGDIKAENILVFRSREGEDMLVIADLGLTELHRKTSRSNQPQDAIARTADFRPPECDIKGGNDISPAFDIWTLGIVFLDMIVWQIGGNELRVQFEEERYSFDHYYRVQKPTYFERIPDGQPHQFRVKPVVIQVFHLNDRYDHCK